MGFYLSITAIVFYLLATYKLVINLINPGSDNQDSTKSRFLVFGAIALLLHVSVLYQNILINGGVNLGFYNALSVMNWTISLLVLLASSMGKPIENLAIVFFPITAIALSLELLFPSTHPLSEGAPLGLEMHVLLSIFAYSLLTIAAMQAVLLAVQDRQISKKHPASIMRLPPMQLMESLLIQLLTVGFFMLSLSLATGLMFLNDIFGQHLVHKTVLSILAWLFYGILLWGRWAWGWRGKKIMNWTIWGFVLLMLAYFGSKFVLELILKKSY